MQAKYSVLFVCVALACVAWAQEDVLAHEELGKQVTALVDEGITTSAQSGIPVVVASKEQKLGASASVQRNRRRSAIRRLLSRRRSSRRRALSRRRNLRSSRRRSSRRRRALKKSVARRRSIGRRRSAAV